VVGSLRLQAATCTAGLQAFALLVGAAARALAGCLGPWLLLLSQQDLMLLHWVFSILPVGLVGMQWE
jgi:hypothetical protein